MESMTTSEIIDRINEIEAVQGKHLPVRCEAPVEVVYSEDDDEYVNNECDEAFFSVVDVKYRAGSHNRLPYIALICR